MRAANREMSAGRSGSGRGGHDNLLPAIAVRRALANLRRSCSERPSRNWGVEHGLGEHLHHFLHWSLRATPSNCELNQQNSYPLAPGAADCGPCSAGLPSSPLLPIPASVPGKHQGWTWALDGGQEVCWLQLPYCARGGHSLRNAGYEVDVLGVPGAGVQTALLLAMYCLTPLRSQSPNLGHVP